MRHAPFSRLARGGAPAAASPRHLTTNNTHARGRALSKQHTIAPATGNRAQHCTTTTLPPDRQRRRHNTTPLLAAPGGTRALGGSQQLLTSQHPSQQQQTSTSTSQTARIYMRARRRPTAHTPLSARLDEMNSTACLPATLLHQQGQSTPAK